MMKNKVRLKKNKTKKHHRILDLKPVQERCYVIHPVIKTNNQIQNNNDLSPCHIEGKSRSPEAKLSEAIGLTQAINLDIQGGEIVMVSRPKSATLIGRGAIDALQDSLQTQDIKVIIVDAVLSPVQHRNLEKIWSVKVIDRTALILEIFGARAKTKEGKLQVELASLSYQRSRLVRSWTHLERQRGGVGFTGGPGESQLEIDRRLIDDKIIYLKKELEDVKRTRGLHRSAREKVPYPIVALAGYTNAGKSTLFNYLTRADIMAGDLLFATLDPTMRSIRLPSGREVILSDTVGFISQLPTHLIAAFRATLEEVRAADLILHVHDSSHPDRESQSQDVHNVLADLCDVDIPMLHVHNKSDQCDGHEEGILPEGVSISALTGDNIDNLLQLIDLNLSNLHPLWQISVDISNGAAQAAIYRLGTVENRHDSDDRATFHVRAPADIIGKWQRYHPEIECQQRVV